MSTFPPEVVSAVLAHMNDDHAEDSVRIVRAFARPGAISAVMSGLDEEAGLWSVTVDGATEEVRVPWPGAPISERAEIRREVVALYERACTKLGIEPSAH